MPERKIPKRELAEAPGCNKYHLKLEYLVTVPDNRKVNCLSWTLTGLYTELFYALVFISTPYLFLSWRKGKREQKELEITC